MFFYLAQVSLIMLFITHSKRLQSHTGLSTQLQSLKKKYCKIKIFLNMC